MTWVDLEVGSLLEMVNKMRTKLYGAAASVPELVSYSVILCKPVWMEGAEMGVNQHGLCIGNEAIFSKVKGDTKSKGLLGMDIVRLALEFCKTTREAVELISVILSTVGQSGRCYFSHHDSADREDDMKYYHNSFLVMDVTGDCYVIESFKKHDFVIRQVTEDVYSISNCLTSGTSYQELVTCDKPPVDKIDVSAAFNDKLITYFGKGHSRCKTTRQHLVDKQGVIELTDVIDTLRLHHHPGQAQSTTIRGRNPFEVNVCMHQSYGPVRISQTTNALVCQLNPTTKEFTMYVTGSSATCQSIFKPLWFTKEGNGCSLSQIEQSTSSGYYDPAKSSYWWQAEQYHRLILLAHERELNSSGSPFGALIRKLDSQRQELERKLLQEAQQEFGSEHQMNSLSKLAFDRCDQFYKSSVDKLLHELGEYQYPIIDTSLVAPIAPLKAIDSFLYIRHWRRNNQLTKLDKETRLQALFDTWQQRALIRLMLSLSVQLLVIVIIWRLAA